MLEARAAFEYLTWQTLRPVLRRLPKGDGHAVLVLPGFITNDRSTTALRTLLRTLGYRSYGWRLGTNVGPTKEIIDGLEGRFREIVARQHGRPVSLIGWSLGGIYAHNLAKAYPADVRQVITMGSPLRLGDGDGSAVSSIWKSYEDQHDPDALQALFDSAVTPLPVPTSSIYTRTDGVVRWQSCLVEDGPLAENIEVIGSHSGLGVNPAVAVVVADRLRQPIGGWRRFSPLPSLSGLYPTAATWQPRRHATS